MTKPQAPMTKASAAQAACAAQRGTSGAEHRIRPRLEMDPGLRSSVAAPAAWCLDMGHL
jgi:hypothetical protein